MFESGGRWVGRIGALVAAAAIMGCLNSILQLWQYTTRVGDVLMGSDWILIGIWTGLLVMWAVGLGIVVGIYIARHWFDAGSAAASVASLD